MKKKKHSSKVDYKRGNVEISGEGNQEVISLARTDQITSWVFKFIRLIIGYLVVENYLIDSIKDAYKLVSWMF